jgi:hypothetical protein
LPFFYFFLPRAFFWGRFYFFSRFFEFSICFNHWRVSNKNNRGSLKLNKKCMKFENANFNEWKEKKGEESIFIFLLLELFVLKIK